MVGRRVSCEVWGGCVYVCVYLVVHVSHKLKSTTSVSFLAAVNHDAV